MNVHRSTRGFLNQAALVGIALLLVISVIVFFIIVKFDTVQGNKAAVKETWSGGVENKAYPAKTYQLWRWTEDLYHYGIDGQVFVMNDKSDSEDNFAEGRRSDALELVASDNQKVIFHITLRWHRDPEKLVPMHIKYRDAVEERLIRPSVIGAIRSRSIVRPAIELYSGETLETVRDEIEKILKDPNGELAINGVVADLFLIDKTILPDTKYVEKIEARQRAIIGESTAKAEEKQNLAEADAAKAKALTKQFQDVVAAETAKKTQILQQEAESERTIIKTKADAINTIAQQKAESEKVELAAKAEAARQIAISEGNKQAEINRAIGIEAIGRAEAEAQKLKLAAFNTAGSELYTRVEVAKSYAIAMDKVRFYPANANFTTIAKDFDGGLSILANPSTTASPTTK
jgi:hypothetical protein